MNGYGLLQILVTNGEKLDTSDVTNVYIYERKVEQKYVTE